MKRKANDRRGKGSKGNALFCSREPKADGNGLTRNEKRTLWYARTYGMLWAFASAAREAAYQTSDGIERSYLNFFARAVPGDPDISDFLKDGFGDGVRFLIDDRVVAVIDESGYLRTFIAVREHHQCGVGDVMSDDKRRTRFGYVEGAGEFFQEMRDKRRIGDFVRGIPR